MRQFKKIILGISLALSLIIIPVQVHAGDMVEVTTFEEYKNAVENKEVSHIKLKNNITNDITGNEIYFRSLDKLKVIDFNGYKISTKKLSYRIHQHSFEGSLFIYDEFKVVFKDSSTSQLGEYTNPDGSQLIDFYKLGAKDTKLTVEILGGSFKSSAGFDRLFHFQNGTATNKLDVNFIIEKGYFEGAYKLFNDQLEGGQMVTNFKNLTYQGYNNGNVRIQESNTIALYNFVDPNQSEMWVDGNKVEDYNEPVGAFVGKKIVIKEKSKTPLTISGLTNNQVFTYDGTPKTPSGTLVVQGNYVQVNDLEVLYQGRGSTSYNSGYAPVNAGEYKVTYKIKDSNPTYSGSVTYNFIINKADPDVPMVAQRFGYVGDALSSVDLPEGFSWNNPTTIMETIGIHTYKATYTPEDTANYNTKTNLDIDVIVTDFRTELLISGIDNNQTFTYNGNPHTPSGTLIVQDDLVPVDELEVLYAGVGTTSYDSVNPPTNAGTYTVTYSISDSNPDYHGNVSYNFEITKALPIVPTVVDLIGALGKELSSVVLPSGFIWEIATTIMDILGLNQFKAIYTPADTNNYEIVTDVYLDVEVKAYYQVNTSVVGNGTITASSEVFEDETFIIEMIPDANHYLKEVTVNGVVTPVTDNKLELVVTEDLDVVATFEIYTYQVTVLDYDKAGVSIDPDGIIHVPHGNHLSLEIIVKPGYKLVELLVNDVDRSADLISDFLTLSNVTEAQEVKVVVEPIVYPLIDGDDKEFILTKGDDVSFKIDADLALFTGVKLDDTLVDPSNYDVNSGSVVVSFKKAYLNSLKPGKYNVTFMFSDGGTATGSLTIRSASLPGTGTNFLSGFMPLLAIFMMLLGAFLLIKKNKKVTSLK